jgi:hypothetical protein
MFGQPADRSFPKAPIVAPHFRRSSADSSLGRTGFPNESALIDIAGSAKITTENE